MLDDDDYAARDAVLLEMGFDGYAAYLASDLWKGIRAKNLHGNCVVCDRRGEVLHHIFYGKAVLDGTGIGKAIVVLCHRCHATIETTEVGTKRDLSEANNELFRLVRLKSSRSRKYPNST